MGYLYRVFRATEEDNRRAILAALEPRAGARLLDLGTSDGEFTLRVAERLGAASVQGIELIGKHAAAARSHGIDVRQADLDEGLPFEDDAFDVVHANQVIEHLSSWHNVFCLALGLQPMPMHVSDETIVGNPLNPLDGRPHADLGRSHVRLFTARALTELCSLHGLERVSMRTAGYYPLPPLAGRLAARIDPTHSAFLIGLFRPSTSRA